MTTLLTLMLCAGLQSASGKPGDLVLRPMIPDPYLIRQSWAQIELGISASQVSELQEESSSQLKAIQDKAQKLAVQGKFEQFVVKPQEFAPKLTALNESYKKRIFELSVQVNGVFGLLNPGVADKVRLSPAQRQRIDQITRDYYTWHDDEWKRLNGWSRFDPNPSAESRGRMGNRLRTPDEFIALKRTVLARWQIRREITAEQMKRLSALGGRSVHNAVPFGFTFNIMPYAPLPYGAEMMLNWPRVHEELGLTMKQSRELMEQFASMKGRLVEAYKLARAELSRPQKRRLRELELQVAGPRAILWHDVRTELELDPDRMDACYIAMHTLHLEKMRLEDGFQSEFQALSRVQPYSFEEDKKIRSRMEAFRRQMESRLDTAAKEAMTDLQLQKLAQMQGRPAEGLLPDWVRK